MAVAKGGWGKGLNEAAILKFYLEFKSYRNCPELQSDFVTLKLRRPKRNLATNWELSKSITTIFHFSSQVYNSPFKNMGEIWLRYWKRCLTPQYFKKVSYRVGMKKWNIVVIDLVPNLSQDFVLASKQFQQRDKIWLGTATATLPVRFGSYSPSRLRQD